MRIRHTLWTLPLMLGGIWLAASGQEPAPVSTPQDGGAITRELARLITVTELNQQHSDSFETNQKFRPVHRQIYQDFGTDAGLQVTWTKQVVTDLNGPPDALDAFERRALERIKAGEREVWEPSAGGARYFRGIKTVGALCVSCHKVVTPHATQEQELIAAISLELRPKAD